MTRDSKFGKKLHVVLGNHDVFYDCVKEHQLDEFSTPISNIYEKNTILFRDEPFLFQHTYFKND